MHTFPVPSAKSNFNGTIHFVCMFPFGSVQRKAEAQRVDPNPNLVHLTSASRVSASSAVSPL